MRSLVEGDELLRRLGAVKRDPVGKPQRAGEVLDCAAEGILAGDLEVDVRYGRNHSLERFEQRPLILDRVEICNLQQTPWWPVGKGQGPEQTGIGANGHDVWRDA